MTDQKNIKEILPCPFCNGSPLCFNKLRPEYDGDKDDEYTDSSYYHFLMCQKCGIEGPWANKKSGAVNAWNKRPQLTKLKKQRDELNSMLQCFVVLDNGDERFAWEHEVLFSEARDLLAKTKGMI